MEEKHVYFMQRAIALAQQGKNSEGGGSFGAVIVKNNQIIAQGHNRVKGTKDCTQHAELFVIQEACKVLQSTDLSECILYTSCEPCMMCLGACHWAKFKRIFYGASALDAKEYGFIYSEVFYQSNEQKRLQEFSMQQLLRDEAVKVWKN